MLPVDFHSHSIASVHAMHTLEELLRHASLHGMDALLVSDHSPGTDNSIWLARREGKSSGDEVRISGPDLHYFRVFQSRYTPSAEYSTLLLKGMEANILGEGAHGCDAPLPLARGFDIVIASVHELPHLFHITSTEHSTERMILAMDGPIDIIGHPCQDAYCPHIEPLVRAAADKGITLELNNASLMHGRARPERVLEMLDWAKKLDCRISLGSDAHVLSELGRDEFITPALEEAEFPDELIVNRTLQTAQAFIAERKAIRSQVTASK